MTSNLSPFLDIFNYWFTKTKNGANFGLITEALFTSRADNVAQCCS